MPLTIQMGGANPHGATTAFALRVERLLPLARHTTRWEIAPLHDHTWVSLAVSLS